MELFALRARPYINERTHHREVIFCDIETNKEKRVCQNDAPSSLCQAKNKTIFTGRNNLPDGYLNLREIVCHILFVPRTIDVAEAWITTELHSLLLDMAQNPCHRLGKTIV